MCVRLGINDRGTVTHFSRDHLRFRSVLYKRRGGEGGGEGFSERKGDRGSRTRGGRLRRKNLEKRHGMWEEIK